MKKHIGGLAAAVLTLALLISSVTDYYAACKDVRQGVLRLHITANSDSAADQEVKLKVRDALLKSGTRLFDGSVTAGEAKEKIEPYLPFLKAEADRILAENGFDYTAEAYIVNEYFDVREYEDITLPAGRYTALRVALGSGEGKNWWCVMFPPLCIPAVTVKNEEEAFAVFNENGADVVKARDGYKVRFKIVETAEKILEMIRGREK